MFAAVFFCAERLRALFATVEKVTLSEDFGAVTLFFVEHGGADDRQAVELVRYVRNHVVRLVDYKQNR